MVINLPCEFFFRYSPLYLFYWSSLIAYLLVCSVVQLLIFPFYFSGNSKNAPVVVEFGSFVMDLFSTTSDLDLSVNFNANADFSREKKIQTLRKFAKKLYSLQSKHF